MFNFLEDSKRTEQKETAYFAEVTEVTNKGVKLKIDGEKEERPKYYNALVNVNVGDRVYLQHVSGTIIIIGKLLY